MRTGSWESGSDSVDFKDVLVSLPEGSSIVIYGGAGDEESRVAATKGDKGSDIILHTPLGDYHTLVGSVLTPTADTVRSMTWTEPLPKWASAGIIKLGGDLLCRDIYTDEHSPEFTNLKTSEVLSWEDVDLDAREITIIYPDSAVPAQLRLVLSQLLTGCFGPNIFDYSWTSGK